ncbi:hypothetical protein N2152v2_001146 [Parachlorella kessleri]
MKQLPRVHAAQVAAALRHWELPRNLTHGDRSVVLHMLRSPPPTFAALFPYLVGHEYHTRTGRGDLLYTNGWGFYAVVEAKQLRSKGAKAKKRLAQRQAQRYAADVLAGLPQAAAVIPFILYAPPAPRTQLLGKRKRESKRQAAAARQQKQGASPAVVVELVPLLSRAPSQTELVGSILALQCSPAALQAPEALESLLAHQVLGSAAGSACPTVVLLTDRLYSQQAVATMLQFQQPLLKDLRAVELVATREVLPAPCSMRSAQGGAAALSLAPQGPEPQRPVLKILHCLEAASCPSLRYGQPVVLRGDSNAGSLDLSIVGQVRPVSPDELLQELIELLRESDLHLLAEGDVYLDTGALSGHRLFYVIAPTAAVPGQDSALCARRFASAEDLVGHLQCHEERSPAGHSGLEDSAAGHLGSMPAVAITPSVP